MPERPETSTRLVAVTLALAALVAVRVIFEVGAVPLRAEVAISTGAS